MASEFERFARATASGGITVSVLEKVPNGLCGLRFIPRPRAMSKRSLLKSIG